MKRTGVIMLMLGLLLTFYSAVTTASKGRDAGGIEPGVTMQDAAAGGWQSYLGIGVLVAGCFFLFREKEV